MGKRDKNDPWGHADRAADLVKIKDRILGEWHSHRCAGLEYSIRELDTLITKVRAEDDYRKLFITLFQKTADIAGEDATALNEVLDEYQAAYDRTGAKQHYEDRKKR